MPSNPAAPVYDEEEVQRRQAPPPPEHLTPPATQPVAPRVGVTGGEVPEFESDRAARQPITWSADPIERQQQIKGEITRRRQASNAEAHPFEPTAWNQDHRAPGSIRADRDFTQQAEEQATYQRQQARVAAVGQRRQELEATKTQNDALEAKYRGNGQQFYTDAHGRIQPVVEEGSGRSLFHPTTWEPGTNPKTGEPALSMRDKYGQRQFKTAPVVPSLDPTDDKMYYKMPDGTTAEAGSIDDLAKHPNYNIAKVALAAKTRNIKAIHQQALEPIKAMADDARSQLEDARSQVQSLDTEIQKTTELANNNAGTPLGDGYAASLGQMQAQRDALDAQTKPKGELGRRAARSRAGYAVASAQAMHDTFAAQQEEIAARVRAAGGKPENDPTYQANLKGMQQASQLIGAANDQFGQIDGNLSPTSAQAGSAPGSAPPPQGQQALATGTAQQGAGAPDVLQQSEPIQAVKRGVKNVGGVSMQEFARRYGSGQGPVQPASVIKLYQRSKEIEDTLANSSTTVNDTLRNQMTKEKEYIDALAKQRFARLDESAQTKITDATRDPTWWEKAKGVGLAVGRGAGEALVDVGESAARNLVRGGLAVTPGGPAQLAAGTTAPEENIADAAQAMREGAESYKASSSPQVEAKLREGALTGAIPEAVGGVLPFAAGGELVGVAGKAAGLSDAAISGLTKAATVAAGAAQSGNSLRREAIAHLGPDLKSGKITQEEYNKSVGLAELAGSTIGGAAMGLGPISKFATRLGNIPAGKTFLSGLLDKAAKGGSGSAMKWLAGEGGNKALASVVREGTEMSGVTFAQDLATDLAAKGTFDPDRKVDPAKAGEQAAKMGVVGALVSALTHMAPKPGAGGEGAKTEESNKPVPPDQQAAEAEFQKKLSEEPPAPPKPSTAEEAAHVFEPALKEKANTPPPAKSAEESAKAIVSETKRMSDSEGDAQKLVDELQQVSGQSRDDILASRKGKETDEWKADLQKEVDYHKNPLVVDPERRATELRGDLKRLDQEWAQHVNQVSADADHAASKDAVKERVAQNMSDARNRHDQLSERRQAIGSELTKAERVRQSGKGASDLKDELTAEQKQAEVDSRKLRTPELEARRDAIETGLNEAERVRQSNKGAADLASDLGAKEGRAAPVDEAVKKISGFTPEEFYAWSREQPQGTTGESYKVGISVIGKPDEIAKLKSAKVDAESKFEKVMDDYKAAPEGERDAASNAMIAAGGKVQFFSEAIHAAENTGSATGAPEVFAAHKKSAEEKQNATQVQSPSEIPVRKPSEDRQGNGVENPVDEGPAATRGGVGEGGGGGEPIAGTGGDQIRDGKADEGRAAPALPKEAVAPAVKTFTPKESSPVSAHVTESTPESVEGKKINNKWTAFDKDSGTLGVPREEMPQVKSEHRGALVNFLRARDIPSKAVMVHPDQLKPTQAEFSPEKVQAAREHTGSERPILISADGHVVDGHHQWLSALDDPKTPMPAIKLNAPVDKVLAEMKEFPSTQSAEGAATKATASAPPATKRLSDRAIEALQRAKIDTNGKVFDATQGLYVAAHNSAIDLAVLGVRAGRAVNDVVKLVIDRFKAKYPDHTPDQISELETKIRAAVEPKTPEKSAAEAILDSKPIQEGKSKIADAWKKSSEVRDLKKTLSATRDAAENLAATASDEAHSTVSNELNRNVPKDQREVAANALSFYREAGGDLGALNDMATKIAQSDKADPKWKASALKAIDYAKANSDKLKSANELYEGLTDTQAEQEQAIGMPTLRRKNYVMHAQDVDEGGWLEPKSGLSPTGKSSQKNRTYDTFADSIAAGIDPKTLNALDLLRSRVKAGQTGIGLRQWQSSLNDYIDPSSKQPIATKPERVDRADGSFYYQPPKGYVNEMLNGTPIAVKNEYAGTIGALTDPSWWSQTEGRRLAQKINSAGKSINLLIDTFHLGRLALRQSILKSASLSDPHLPVPSYTEGKTILEHSPTELTKMAQNGEISKEALPDLLEKKKKLNILTSNGLNIGHVADAMHQDMVSRVPFVGEFFHGTNKFIFEKFQRGAMAEAAMMEFDRQSKSYPDLKPDEVARKVASDINTRFGNLGRQGIFKSKTAQDIARMICLAPQWNEGLIRSELGGVGQIGKSVSDALTGKRLAMGALGRDMISGTLGIFVANQLINQGTRGKFTWENPEEGWGSRLSAWIPDNVGGKGSGFFLNPLGVTAEISHLLLNSYERKGSGWEAVKDFARSRSSASARPFVTWLTGQDALGGKIKAGDMTKEVVNSAVPAPIGGSAAVAAIRGGYQRLTTGQGANTETYPGQLQKQVMSTFGLKTDTAPSPEQRMTALAKNYKTKHGIEPAAEFYAGDYSDLTNALRRNNPKDIQSELKDLMAKKTPDEIRKHYQSWGRTPFTGQKDRESDFIRTLNPEQRTTYMKAQQERKSIGDRALSAVGRIPRQPVLAH